MSAELLDRFDPYTDEGNYYGYGKMLPEPEGDWVRYADHANALSRLTAELEAVKRERDGAIAANERDRTAIIVAVNALSDAFSRRDWLIRGGRGSYEWDDDRFRDEFRDAMEEFKPHVDALRKIGADRTNCPETQHGVDIARNLLDRAETAERALAKAREALRPFGDEAAKWAGYDDDEPLTEGWSGGPASELYVKHLRRAREAGGGDG